MKLSPEDKAELDASMARSDYILQHHRQKFNEEADKIHGKMASSVTWFVYGMIVGSLITFLSFMVLNIVRQL